MRRPGHREDRFAAVTAGDVGVADEARSRSREPTRHPETGGAPVASKGEAAKGKGTEAIQSGILERLLVEDEKLAGKREPPRCPPLLLAASEDETTGATRFANTLLKTAGAKSLEDLAELLHKTGNPVDAMRLALAGVAESAAMLHAQKREKTRARAEELLQSAQEATKMASEDALGNRMRALEAERAARKAEELARSKGKLAEEVLQKAAQTARATQECLQELAQACGTKP